MFLLHQKHIENTNWITTSIFSWRAKNIQMAENSEISFKTMKRLVGKKNGQNLFQTSKTEWTCQPKYVYKSNREKYAEMRHISVKTALDLVF